MPIDRHDRSYYRSYYKKYPKIAEKRPFSLSYKGIPVGDKLMRQNKRHI